MLRIACVPYLNAKPLIEGLEGVLLEPPAKLGTLLARGRVDVALLPAFEVLRRGWAVVPGLAIASPGPADSVRLHLRRPLESLRTVALDPASRSTNALTRILMARHFQRDVRFIRREPADAAVTIGDASFRDQGCPSIDLASAWREYTGLPFVFALWAHEPDHPKADEIERTLKQARARGRRALETIVEREHRRVGISRDRCRTYLTRCITFDLGAKERRGLARFEREARELGLLAEDKVLAS